MTSMSLTIPGTRRRSDPRWTDDSTPRVVALDRAGHAARPPAPSHELGAFEGDDGALVVRDAPVASEEVHPLYHPEASTFHLAQRTDVSRIREHETGAHRGEVAPRRPLLAFLHHAAVSAA